MEIVCVGQFDPNKPFKVKRRINLNSKWQVMWGIMLHHYPECLIALALPPDTSIATNVIRIDFYFYFSTLLTSTENI